MRILVNCLGKTEMREINETMLIGDLLKDMQIQNQLPESSYLVNNGATLPLSEEIGQILSNNSVLDVAIEIRGGGKKGGKKRKAYTTPKKNKHKRVNVKKAALSYFAIENDGTVKRVKKRSMQVGCKHRGIFMANHWNRYYCGYSHLTLMKKDAPKEEPKRVKKAAAVEEKKDDKKKGKGKKK